MGIVRSFLGLHRSLPSPSDELARVFAKFDTNGNGCISSFELVSIFETLGHPRSAGGSHAHDGRGQRRPEEVTRMMVEVNADKDCFISLVEFVDHNTTPRSTPSPPSRTSATPSLSSTSIASISINDA